MILIHLIFFPEIIFLIINFKQEINIYSTQLFQFIIEELIINLNKLKQIDTFILVHYQFALIFEKISQTLKINIIQLHEMENHIINDNQYIELKSFCINCIKAISFYNEVLIISF